MHLTDMWASLGFGLTMFFAQAPAGTDHQLSGAVGPITGAGILSVFVWLLLQTNRDRVEEAKQYAESIKQQRDDSEKRIQAIYDSKAGQMLELHNGTMTRMADMQAETRELVRTLMEANRKTVEQLQDKLFAAYKQPGGEK